MDKALRGHGQGRHLMNLAEDYVKSRGISRMFLSCLQDNAGVFLHRGYRYCEPKVATLGSAVSVDIKGSVSFRKQNDLMLSSRENP